MRASDCSSRRTTGRDHPIGAARGSADGGRWPRCSPSVPTSPCSTNPPTTWGSAASTTCSTRSRRPRRPWCSPRMMVRAARARPLAAARARRLTSRGRSGRTEQGTPPSRYPGPMSTEGLAAAQRKMADDGVAQTAIDVFSHYYGQLEDGVTGTIPEDTIEPYLDPPLLEDVKIDVGEAKQV